MANGISCWPWGDQNCCRRTIDQGEREGNESFYARAGREGWRIGHYDGQAYYVCPEHKDGVYDAVRLRGYVAFKPYSQRLRVDRLAAARRRRNKGRDHFRKFRHVSRHGLRWILVPLRADWLTFRTRDREKARAA